MKRLVTIALLFLFLLNVLGFYGVFVGLQFKYDQEANALLDDESYSLSEAMTVKIPMAVPYSTDQPIYERVSGEFEHQGEIYRLVKQKLYRDTLYVVCVKDSRSKKINQALTDYVKTFTDKPINAKQQGGKQVLSFIKDYISTGVSVESQSSGWNEAVTYGSQSTVYFSLFSATIKYPPRQVLLA